MCLDLLDALSEPRQLNAMPDDGIMILVDRQPQLVKPGGQIVHSATVLVDDRDELVKLVGVVVGSDYKLIEKPVVGSEPCFDPVEPFAMAADRLRHLGKELVDRREINAVTALHATKMIQQAAAGQQCELRPVGFSAPAAP